LLRALRKKCGLHWWEDTRFILVLQA
jgi:hypothetical protein